MHRIEIADFLVIAEIHTGIDAHQLARMPRVVALGSSALAAPFAGFGDVEVFPSFGAKAAIYCARISNYQPLPDGNKRTGYDVMMEFIERNDHSFEHVDGDILLTANMIEQVSAKSITEEEFIGWISGQIR